MRLVIKAAGYLGRSQRRHGMAYGAAGKQRGVAGAYTQRNTQGRGHLNNIETVPWLQSPPIAQAPAYPTPFRLGPSSVKKRALHAPHRCRVISDKCNVQFPPCKHRCKQRWAVFTRSDKGLSTMQYHTLLQHEKMRVPRFKSQHSLFVVTRNVDAHALRNC